MLSACLPGVVRGAVGSDLSRGAVHVAHAAGVLLLGCGDGAVVALLGLPILLAGHRVFRYRTEVMRRDEIFYGLWRLLLIERVLRDQFAHVVKVLLQHRLSRAAYGLSILGNRDGDQDQKDADNDHQLNEGESRLAGVILHPIATSVTTLEDLLDWFAEFHLPIPVLGAIERDALRFGVHIEHAIAVKGIGV